jgi:hypothetical protein
MQTLLEKRKDSKKQTRRRLIRLKVKIILRLVYQRIFFN